jgi:hypothetical protein
VQAWSRLPHRMPSSGPGNTRRPGQPPQHRQSAPEQADLRVNQTMPPARCKPCIVGDLAHPEDRYQRSVMCLTAWLITNAGAGLCIRMRRGNSLISATWPRFATPVRGSPAGRVRASPHWWDAIGSGVTHAGMRAGARPRRAWAGWARWGFPGFPGPPLRISCQTPGRVVASTSGLSRSAERCRKDARSDSRRVPSPSRVRDSGSLSVFGCRAQSPHRGSMPTPDARPG